MWRRFTLSSLIVSTSLDYESKNVFSRQLWQQLADGDIVGMIIKRILTIRLIVMLKVAAASADDGVKEKKVKKG